MFLKEILPHQLETAVTGDWPLLIPAGCIEFHGNHMALGTDSIIVEELCRRIAETTECVIAPPLDYGVTGYALSGPEAGTIDIDCDVFYHQAKEILRNFWEMGFSRIYAIIWHQGLDAPEALALRKAASELAFEMTREEHGRGWWGRQRPAEEGFGKIRVASAVLAAARAAGVRGDHAGKCETSLLMYLRPELVDMKELSRKSFWYCERSDNLASDATPELGGEMMDIMIQSWVKELRKEKPATTNCVRVDL